MSFLKWKLKKIGDKYQSQILTVLSIVVLIIVAYGFIHFIVPPARSAIHDMFIYNESTMNATNVSTENTTSDEYIAMSNTFVSILYVILPLYILIMVASIILRMLVRDW